VGHAAQPVRAAGWPWGHFRELRARLMRVVLVLVVAAIVAFVF
jgi:Sec-independent protein secretion pathway component TatC